MSRRKTAQLLSGTAVSLALMVTGALGQQPRNPPPRAAQPPAQQPAPDAEATALGTLAPAAAGTNPPVAPAIAPGAPPRASKPVRAPQLRGTTQREIRKPRPTVVGLPPATEPAPPLRRKPVVEEDPYAPLGLRLGSITVKPGITTSLGYDTNPQRVAGTNRNSSSFARYEGDVELKSDWNVHELSGRLRGSYADYFRDREASRPDAAGSLNLRLDATRDTKILLESRLLIDTQRPGSPDLTAAVSGRPLVYQYGASAGVRQDFNRLQVTLRGSVDRSDYEDAQLTNGAILSQSDRNQTQYGLRLRTGYEITPGFTPFLQAEIDTRDFDQAVDSNGYRRSSNGLTGSLGSSFEISRQLTGEFTAGYQTREYDDVRLKNLRGFVGDAAILWSPTPLTTVTLRGSSELGDTTVAGSSGTTARRVTLEVAHALRRNLTVTGFTTFLRTLYEGQGLREDTTAIGARIEYKLTRTFAVRASFTHERLNSTNPGSDYTANVAQVGLRVQF